ncbi:hypothetical protein P7C70_g5441, partial [Phenoliferia sp. Uapishka_3]
MHSVSLSDLGKMPGSASLNEDRCRNCQVMIGESHERPILKCSGCFRTVYCSTDCQKEHWRTHKPLCRGRAKEQGEIEVLALAQPSLAALEKELHEYSLDIEEELRVASRSALSLGRKNCMSRSHFIHLVLTWDPSTPTLREHFKVDDIVVQPIKDCLGEGGPGMAVFYNVLQKAGRCGKEDDELPHGRELLHGYVFQAWMKKNPLKVASTDRREVAAKTKLCRTDSECFETVLSVFERKLNPQWEEQLRRSLEKPKRTWMELDIEDSVKSEGRESFLATLRSQGCHPIASVIERTYRS